MAYPLTNPACPTSGCTKLKDPARLAALQATGMVGSPPEASFDRFTRLASTLLDAPITAITLVDSERLFIKSHVGLTEPLASVRSKPVDQTFCKYIVDTVEPLVINDTRLDDRICDYDLVTDGALAYLAIPLISADKHTLGTFCAMYGEPRYWSERDISIMSDLATSVMSEIELRMLSGRLLEQYNQLRASELQRDDMLQMLVHDLRNPLTSLLAGLTLIDNMAPLAADQVQALNIAKRGGDALLAMINEMLEVSRHEAGQTQLRRAPTALPPLLDAACDQVRHLALKAGVALVSQRPDDLPMVSLDADKIRRVLVNLLSNALQHTPAGGQVSLEATLDDSDRLALCVRDNGLGIPADQIGHIFEKFSRLQLKRLMGASTGLGLAFCRQVAQAHGGDIEVESTLSRGSVFRLVLPLTV
ncbi:MAG: GAF domain-containing sensor histidine kinase [Perlucidibaca sp.]